MIALLSPAQIEQNRLDIKDWLSSRTKRLEVCSYLYPLRQEFGNHKFYYEIEEIIDINHNHETHICLSAEIELED